MRIVLQRVSRASVRVDGDVAGSIGAGLLLLGGVEPDDESLDLGRVAARVCELRIFADDAGRMNRSLEDVDGELLLVSQFTLCADTHKGRRPGFDGAATPEVARAVIDRLVAAFRDRGRPPEVGVFGARMDVELTNDGPVTFLLDLAPPGGVR
ncbi:MAG: D-tyrosyl-tRNA(Tyr) deacylase [Candidatus Bipolaricaulota bacterium]|nr:MAG: D-tyrosyl-tRNA(Tyr) deacylase [Candidatus Bipolaricaulota bacterium]